MPTDGAASSTSAETTTLTGAASTTPYQSAASSSTTSMTATTCPPLPTQDSDLSIVCGSNQAFFLQASSCYGEVSNYYLYFDPASPPPTIEFTPDLATAVAFTLNGDCRLAVNDGPFVSNIASEETNYGGAPTYVFFFPQSVIQDQSFAVLDCSVSRGTLSCNAGGDTIFSVRPGQDHSYQGLLLIGSEVDGDTFELYLNVIPVTSMTSSATAATTSTAATSLSFDAGITATVSDTTTPYAAAATTS